jgi:hypothetical protein
MRRRGWPLTWRGLAALVSLTAALFAAWRLALALSEWPR